MTKTELKQSIGFITATAIVVGTVIGSGIFMKPAVVIEATGNSTFALLAWIIGGIITLASGLTIAEVSSKIPETGGLYVYIEKVYGKFWGFLCGWVQTIIYGPAVIGALGLYFGTLFAGIFSLPKESELWIGIMAVLFLSVVNTLGSQVGGIVQSVLTAAKLLPIFLIIVFGVFKGNVPIFGMDSDSSQAINFGAAVLATLWAYDGWMNVGFVAGEMKNPAKTLPKAIITGILIVMFAYVAVNVALLHVLRADDIVALGPNAASEAATILFGSFGGKLIAIGILISIFGCLNGKVLTFPRMPLAMAIDGLFPLARYFSRIHPKWRTPVLATFMQITIATIMMLLGNADRLTDIAIFSVFLFYGFAFYAVFLLRKSLPSNEQLYRVPFYPFTPIVAIVGTAYIIISTVLHAPLDTFLSIVVTISGIPVYYIVTKKRQG
ncbi:MULTISPECIES: APC family permease [Anoxybacillus]|uniref:Amino acid permease n=1 Tax=Anoxybacillus flavithermus TaxID=33934 RepID=A0A178TNQ3_9BACL|nr:amino acid permease [Anoxybacillus flavithermus]ASA95826.1 serine/threonine protein kinase [Anoxybacillus flavithermus]ELK22052.1 serine/threonine exchanger SteT [Anoxybacillus flavithermus TNO-09.006]MBE2906033.1 amino acid permease [Anoxybacillus flavithermus]MBE2908628.1 amino acid permease [Anoxybacillus flavithermus]MBE2911300.1 amino acid permease [Anoxybacillus flavithermus]